MGRKLDEFFTAVKERIRSLKKPRLRFPMRRASAPSAAEEVIFGSHVVALAPVVGGGRNVNVWFSNWSWTGQTVPTPQAELDVTIQWTDAAGNPQEHIETVRFPNILADVPIAWVKDWVEDGLLKALRVKAGVD